MPQFYTLLTDTGQAKVANAVALGTTLDLTQMAVGDGNGNPTTPNASADALVNEVRRAPINRIEADADNPTWIVVEQVLPPDVGGWTIREVGVFDAVGDLIAIGNLPETYKPVLSEGSSRTQTIRVVIEVSDTAAVTLKIDPSVVLATREYVDDGDEAVKAEIEQGIAAAGYQFANYDGDRIYTTGEIVRGSDGRFYEFYDRDLAGTIIGVDPTASANRPHKWMEWHGVRPGTVIEWRSETLPEGYVENDGAEISRSAYRRIYAALGTLYGAGDGSTTFQLPDDRGEFKRGWDHGRGVDSERSLYAWQSSANKSHGHMFDIGRANGSGGGRYDSYYLSAYESPASTGVALGKGFQNGLNDVLVDRDTFSDTGTRIKESGEVEARPRNVAVIYLTKI